MTADPLEGAVSPQARAGRYDSQVRRRAQRQGRMKGCLVNIPMDDLLAAGIDPNGPAPWYRTAGYQRSRNGHTVIVSLYTEP